MSDIIEKLADFDILEISNNKRLEIINSPSDYPLNSSTYANVIFMNIVPDKEYIVKLEVDDVIISSIKAVISSRVLSYARKIDGITYGKSQGKVPFTLHREKPGEMKFSCSLWHNDNKIDSITKYYSFEETYE